MKIPWYLMAKGKGSGTGHASGPIAHWTDGVDAPLKSLLVNIDPVQEGTGDPSPDNVRPISGWSAVNVWNDPKYGGNIEWNQLVNLSDMPAGSHNEIIYTKDGASGYVTISGTLSEGSSNTYKMILNSTKLVVGHKYFGSVGNSQSDFLIWHNAPETLEKNSGIFTVNVPGNGIYLYRKNITGGTIINETLRPFVCDLTEMFGAGNEPTTVEQFRALFPHDYYEYNTGTTTCVSAVNGDTYETLPITWQTEAGTVYGGTLDVVSGVMAVDKVMVVLDEDAWADPGESTVLTTIDAVLDGRYRASESGSAARIIYGLSNYFPTNSDGMLEGVRSNGVNSNKLQIYDYKTSFSVSSFQEFQAIVAANPMQVAYRLATPIEYTLAPQQISSLLGENNIWADTGDVTVEYESSGGSDPNLMKLAVAFMGRR